MQDIIDRKDGAVVRRRGGPRANRTRAIVRFVEPHRDPEWRQHGLHIGSKHHLGVPGRHCAMLNVTAGYDGDPKLQTAFDKECRDGPDCHLSQIIEGPILFYTLCERHALPIYGHAYVGYIADDRIIGISKLTRLVRPFTKRFTLQGRIGL